MHGSSLHNFLPSQRRSNGYSSRYIGRNYNSSSTREVSNGGDKDTSVTSVQAGWLAGCFLAYAYERSLLCCRPLQSFHLRSSNDLLTVAAVGIGCLVPQQQQQQHLNSFLRAFFPFDGVFDRPRRRLYCTGWFRVSKPSECSCCSDFSSALFFKFFSNRIIEFDSTHIVIAQEYNVDYGNE